MKIYILTIIIWILSSNVVSIYAQENNRNYLTFRSTKSTKSKIQIENIGGNNPDIEYSTDGTNWTQFENKKAVEVNEAIYVRGNNPDGFSKSDNKYTKFKVTNSPEVTGSIMSLIDGEGKQTEIPCDYCFYSLFSSCTTLMTVPELTATTLTEGCYKLMFSGCTNITTMPNLPATKLATSCYESMFSGCTKLKVTKPLIAETIVAGCYKEMFSGCTKVNNVVVNFNNWEENATTDWLTNTASTGSIICSKQLETEVISKIIPENWTLVTPDYLKITAQEDNVDIELNSYGTAKCNSEYAFEGLFFTPYTEPRRLCILERQQSIQIFVKLNKLSSIHHHQKRIGFWVGNEFNRPLRNNYKHPKHQLLLSSLCRLQNNNTAPFTGDRFKRQLLQFNVLWMHIINTSPRTKCYHTCQTML